MTFTGYIVKGGGQGAELLEMTETLPGELRAPTGLIECTHSPSTLHSNLPLKHQANTNLRGKRFLMVTHQPPPVPLLLPIR